MVNTKTPKDVAEREQKLRKEGFQVHCGPSFAAAHQCVRGKHGHLWDPPRLFSTHYVDAQGGLGGAHAGGACDIGRDPAPGITESLREKAHLNALAHQLMREGFRVVWGVERHFDHLHFDYNRDGGNDFVEQGPNGEFTVAHITEVQRRLSALRRSNGRRYYTGKLDGLREEHTLKAIKAFQRDHGLKDDGDPGRLTSDALKNALARQKEAEKKAQKEAGKAPGKKKKDDASVAGVAGLAGPTLRERMAPFRIAGQNAFATAVAADRFTPPAGTGVLLAARGTPDETAGSLAAFRTGGSFLPLREDGRLPGPVRARLQETRPAWVRVVGGFLAVPDETVAEILAAAGIRF